MRTGLLLAFVVLSASLAAMLDGADIDAPLAIGIAVISVAFVFAPALVAARRARRDLLADRDREARRAAQHPDAARPAS